MKLFFVVMDSMVFAAVTGGYVGASNPLTFPVVKVNLGQQWDSDRSVFTVTEEGVYFLGLTVGAGTRTKADYRLVVSGTNTAGITRSSTSHSSVDSIGMEVLRFLKAGNTVHISTLFTIFSYEDYMQTAITIFSISKIMKEGAAAFSVAKVVDISGYKNPVSFGTYSYNVYNHYDKGKFKFIALSAGVYYFSFSVGLHAGGRARFYLYRNTSPVCNILRDSTTHTGTDTIGRSVMIELQKGDMVYIVNLDGYTARSTGLKETSFTGFKYEPKHGNQVNIEFICLRITLPS